MKKKYFVYIIETKKNTFYTGYTTNLKKRYKEHIKGTIKCKYTRSFGVSKLLVVWEIKGSKNLALRIESLIKKYSRAFKKKLIETPELLLDFIEKKYDENYDIIVVSSSIIKELNDTYSSFTI